METDMFKGIFESRVHAFKTLPYPRWMRWKPSWNRIYHEANLSFVTERSADAVRCRHAAGTFIRRAAPPISASRFRRRRSRTLAHVRGGAATVSRRDVLRGEDHRSSSAPLPPCDKRSSSSGERRYPLTVVGTPAATPAIRRWVAGRADNPIRTKRREREGKDTHTHIHVHQREFGRSWINAVSAVLATRPVVEAARTDTTPPDSTRRDHVAVHLSLRLTVFTFVRLFARSFVRSRRIDKTVRRDGRLVSSRAFRMWRRDCVPLVHWNPDAACPRRGGRERRWRGHRGSTTVAATKVSVTALC